MAADMGMDVGISAKARRKQRAKLKRRCEGMYKLIVSLLAVSRPGNVTAHSFQQYACRD